MSNSCSLDACIRNFICPNTGYWRSNWRKFYLLSSVSMILPLRVIYLDIVFGNTFVFVGKTVSCHSRSNDLTFDYNSATWKLPY